MKTIQIELTKYMNIDIHYTHTRATDGTLSMHRFINLSYVLCCNRRKKTIRMFIRIIQRELAYLVRIRKRKEYKEKESTFCQH